MKILRLVACFLLFSTLAYAQAQPSNPQGKWRCINNAISGNNLGLVTDMVLMVSPNQTLVAQGTIVYTATNQIYNIQGGGDWAYFPPDASSAEWLLKFRVIPQTGNHAIFPIMARPTTDPNSLYYFYQDPRTGNTSETRCGRIG